MASVIYYSMTGNTKKMAEAIAGELGVEARDVKKTAEVPRDGILFLGSGCYGGKPGEEMAKLIADGDLNGRRVAVFGTSGGGDGKETADMADALRKKGALVLGSYHARGKAFVLFSLGHPSAGELEGARAFAREMSRIG